MGGVDGTTAASVTDTRTLKFSHVLAALADLSEQGRPFYFLAQSVRFFRLMFKLVNQS